MKCLMICLSAFAVAPSGAVAGPDWHVCTPFEKRVNCIVDGDTLWYQGEKMRLRGVDTPEMDGRCVRERTLAQDATDLHLAMIASGILQITRFGQDRFGRTLVEVETATGQVGPMLVRQGLADIYADRHRNDWCS